MTTLTFAGKVAIVTGGGRGLGREFARMLAARGANVVVNDLGHGPTGVPLDEDPAQSVVAQIKAAGGDAVASREDVVHGAAHIVSQALDSFGRLDILINNAGFSGGGMFADIPPADWHHLLSTHLDGAVNMSRAAWPHLAQAGAGRIINMSSAASFGAPFTAHYSTAKSAMIGLTRSLAGEGQLTGITVNAIMPSALTRLTAQIPIEALCAYMDKHFAPSRVAPFVVWLVHETTRINGEIFAVGGGKACRVVLARGQYASASADTPEAWAAQADHVMAMDRLDTPLSMMEQLCLELSAIDEEGIALAESLRSNLHFMQ